MADYWCSQVRDLGKVYKEIFCVIVEYAKLKESDWLFKVT